MRATILDGTEAGGSLSRAGAVVREELAGRGWEVTSFLLREIEIAPCRGCFQCWTRTPGICTTDDAAREVTRSIIQGDLVVYITPIPFGGYSFHLKKALDRSIGLVLPFFTRINDEVHHLPRYERYPRIAAIGGQIEPDEEGAALFHALVGRNAINMHAPAYASIVIRSGDDLAEQVRALLQQMEVSA